MGGLDIMEIKFLSRDELVENIDKFCELSAARFTAKINEDIVRHRFLENPYEDLILCVAIDDGKLVSTFGAMPSVMMIDNKPYKTGIFVNVMTLPEYEGKGLIVTLMKKVCEKMKEDGYAFGYSFPNYASNPIFCAKLDGIDIYEIPTLQLKIDPEFEVEPVSVMSTDDWSNLKEESTDSIHVLKEEKYITWRYKNHRTNDYKIVKFSDDVWCIYNIYQKEINITEYHYAGNPDNLRLIINYLYNVAKENNFEKITTWCKTNTKAHLMFERCGFLNSAPIRYFNIVNLTYDGKTDITDSRNWNIFMGDDNVY